MSTPDQHFLYVDRRVQPCDSDLKEKFLSLIVCLFIYLLLLLLLFCHSHFSFFPYTFFLSAFSIRIFPSASAIRRYPVRVLQTPLRNDSSFAVQFSISVSKTRAILLFKIKIKLIEVFELHERMPGMRSVEYQATILLKFFIIIHNYANV